MGLAELLVVPLGNWKHVTTEYGAPGEKAVLRELRYEAIERGGAGVDRRCTAEEVGTGSGRPSFGH